MNMINDLRAKEKKSIWKLQFVCSYNQSWKISVYFLYRSLNQTKIYTMSSHNLLLCLHRANQNHLDVLLLLVCVCEKKEESSMSVIRCLESGQHHRISLNNDAFTGWVVRRSRSTAPFCVDGFQMRVGGIPNIIKFCFALVPLCQNLYWLYDLAGNTRIA